MFCLQSQGVPDFGSRREDGKNFLLVGDVSKYSKEHTLKVQVNPKGGVRGRCPRAHARAERLCACAWRKDFCWCFAPKEKMSGTSGKKSFL